MESLGGQERQEEGKEARARPQTLLPTQGDPAGSSLHGECLQQAGPKVLPHYKLDAFRLLCQKVDSLGSAWASLE